MSTLTARELDKLRQEIRNILDEEISMVFDKIHDEWENEVIERGGFNIKITYDKDRR